MHVARLSLAAACDAEHAPARGEKSGWLFATIPQKKKRFGRKKKGASQTNRHWFVLEGQRLTYYDNVDGTELGHFDLLHANHISGEDHAEDSRTFVIEMEEGKSDVPRITLRTQSRQPDKTDHDICVEWLKVLRSAKSRQSHEFGSSHNTGMMF